MKRLRAAFERIRPGDLFSPPVWLGTSAELVIVQLTSPYNTPDTIALRVLLQVVAVVVAALFLGAIHLGARRHLSEAQLRVLLLSAVPVSGLLGGAVLGWTFHETGLDPQSLWALRVFATFMHVTALSTLLWVAVSGVRLHYARLERLMQERATLAVLDQQVTRDLADLDVEATEMVRARILEGLAPAESAADVLPRLLATIEDVVRPLSRQLESESEPWSPPTGDQRIPDRIRWRRVATEGLSSTLVSPPGVVIILALLGTPMNLARNGLSFQLKFVAVVLAIALPLSIVIHRVFVALSAGRGAMIRAALFVAMCLLMGLALGIATLPITINTPKPLRFLILGPLFTLIIACAWGFAVAAQRQAQATHAIWSATTQELAWRIARARELHRQQRRALAHAVHGQVQAALAAGILQLQAAMADGSVTEEMVESVRRRIVDSVESLDLRAVHPADLREIIAKVQATWAGIAEIELVASDRLEELLRADPQCMATLEDVLPELVFNSIKHGKAATVTLVLDEPNERVIRLLVTDDGLAPLREITSGVTPGLGSRLLDDCAIEWSRTSDGGRTLTSVLLPHAPVKVGQLT